MAPEPLPGPCGGESLEEGGPPNLCLPLTTLLLILTPPTLLLEVTQLLWGDTQVPAGEMSWLTEVLGLQARRLRPGRWGQEPGSWAGHLCGCRRGSGWQGLGFSGREGAQQAHRALACSGLTG